MQVDKGIRKFEEATDPSRPLSKVRIGLDWIGLDWIGLDWMARSPALQGEDWIGLDGLSDWIGLDGPLARSPR